MITPFEGKSPQFDETVFIDPSARLIGDILLEPDVSIRPMVNRGLFKKGSGTSLLEK